MLMNKLIFYKKIDSSIKDFIEKIYNTIQNMVVSISIAYYIINYSKFSLNKFYNV